LILDQCTIRSWKQ